MNRSDLNEAVQSYLNKGGKITKLPDGPDFRFQAYGVSVKPSNKVDLTSMEDPGSKKQSEAYESNKL